MPILMSPPRLVRNRFLCFLGLFLSFFFIGNLDVATAQTPGAVFARAGHSVGVVLVGNWEGKLISAGSAVAVDSRLMVTNYHVLTDKASRIYIFLNSRRYDANIYHCEKEQDLCLIEVQGLDVPPVEFASLDDLKVGDTTFAIGGPNEILNAFAVSKATNQKQMSPPQVTLSQGMVTALRPLANGTLIQTSAAISPGSSGGGLFDGKGRLLGITTFQMRNGQNINFALPVDWVRNMGVAGGSGDVDYSQQGTTSSPAPAPMPALTVAANDADPAAAHDIPAATSIGDRAQAQSNKKELSPWWIAFGTLVLGISAGVWISKRHGGAAAHDLAIESPAGPDPEVVRLEAQIADEFERGQIDEVIWKGIKPYVEGEPEKAKKMYIQRKLPVLQREEKERLWNEAVAKSKGEMR